MTPKTTSPTPTRDQSAKKTNRNRASKRSGDLKHVHPKNISVASPKPLPSLARPEPHHTHSQPAAPWTLWFCDPPPPPEVDASSSWLPASLNPTTRSCSLSSTHPRPSLPSSASVMSPRSAHLRPSALSGPRAPRPPSPQHRGQLPGRSSSVFQVTCSVCETPVLSPRHIPILLRSPSAPSLFTVSLMGSKNIFLPIMFLKLLPFPAAHQGPPCPKSTRGSSVFMALDPE